MPSRTRAGADVSSELVTAIPAVGTDLSGNREGPGAVSLDADGDPRPRDPPFVDPSRVARRGSGGHAFLGSLQTATLRVAGKGGREVGLPLPQDVGDALLDYLRVGRPPAPSDHVFLRSMAPFKPFGGRRPGHAVTHVAFIG